MFCSLCVSLNYFSHSQAKHIQYVSGVRTSTYWLSTFAWDMLNALGPIVISIVLFAAFQIKAYSTVDALVAIFLLLVSLLKSSNVDSLMISLYLSSFPPSSLQVLSSWASIPFTYMSSFVFSNSLTAYALLMIFFFFSSMVS